jgi:hypothetical protein
LPGSLRRTYSGVLVNMSPGHLYRSELQRHCEGAGSLAKVKE